MSGTVYYARRDGSGDVKSQHDGSVEPRRVNLTAVADGDAAEATPSSDQLTPRLLRELHDLYAGPLLAFALRLSGDRQRAEEAVQDALLRAWQHPEAVDGSRGSARAWLYTVVRNRLTDSWRRDAARPRTASPELLDLIGGPDEAERAVEAWGVGDAMRKLTDSHREILHYSYYLGLSVEETSSLLQIPAGTVKSRTYYALRSLRALLEEMGYVQ